MFKEGTYFGFGTTPWHRENVKLCTLEAVKKEFEDNKEFYLKQLTM
jgi:hypothetical protein